MKPRSGHMMTPFLLAVIPLTLWIVVACSTAAKKVELTDESVAHWNATVGKTIPEPQRAAKLKELGQQLIDVSKSIQQDVEAFNHQAMALNENYDATKEEFQQLVSEFAKKRNPKFAQYRDIIFAMRSEVSAEEWKGLTK